MPPYAMPPYTAYLLYAPEKDTLKSLRFGLPTVTSVMTTIKSDITTVSTIMFGAENNYAIDLGNSKTYQLSFTRVNPMEIDDT